MANMQLLIENWRDYHRRETFLSNPEYITEVLGIKVPLTESYPYSFRLNEQILQEQLLFEGFFDQLSAMPGQAKQLFTILRELISDPERIKSWNSAVWRMMIKGPYMQLKGLLKILVEKLPELKMPKFAATAEKALATITNIVTKIRNAPGWKGAMALTGLGLAFKSIWSKVGGVFQGAKEKAIELIQGQAVDELKKWLQGTIITKGLSVVQNVMKDLAAAAATSLTGIGAWFAWAQKAFEGAKFVLNALAGAMKRFGGIRVNERAMLEETQLYIKGAQY
jgi:hypothetical protein